MSETIFLNGTTVTDGTLTAPGQTLLLSSDSTAETTGPAIDNFGTLQTLNSRTITLLGTSDNSGLIGPGTVGLNTFVVDSTTTGGGIHKVTTIGGTLTFTGGGRVELGDDIGSVVLIGTSYGGTIENVDNLISIAFGGISGLVLRNDAGATIDATGGGAITVEAGSTNDGVIRSTATAGGFFVSGVLANRGTIVSEGSSNAIDIEASVDN